MIKDDVTMRGKGVLGPRLQRAYEAFHQNSLEMVSDLGLNPKATQKPPRPSRDEIGTSSGTQINRHLKLLEKAMT